METEKVLIKQFDPSLPLPEYKTPGAVAFDLSSRLDIEIAPHTYEKVPLNVAMKIPAGHWGLLAARSSLHKRGLQMVNGVGIMDQDYCGDEDEYIAVLYNFSPEMVRVEKGDRLAQVVILPYRQIPIEAVTALATLNRGGFGAASGIK